MTIFMLKEKLPLIVALGIPVVLIGGVLIFTYLIPLFAAQPAFDFVYATQQDANQVRVQNGRIIAPTCTTYQSQIRSCLVTYYRYDISEDRSIFLTDSEAYNLSIDPSPQSPDGYRLDTQRRSYDIFTGLFGGRSAEQSSLSREGYRKPIDLEGQYYQVKFLGWIK
jgi:hypothetical protein